MQLSRLDIELVQKEEHKLEQDRLYVNKLLK